MCKIRVAAASCGAALLAATSAGAAPPGQDAPAEVPADDGGASSPAASEARRLFFLGRDAWKAEQFEQACAHFRASAALSSSPATTLNLARCAEREGDREQARRSYEQALSEARAYPEREKGELWAAAAQRELDALGNDGTPTVAPAAAPAPAETAPPPSVTPTVAPTPVRVAPRPASQPPAGPKPVPSCSWAREPC